MRAFIILFTVIAAICIKAKMPNLMDTEAIEKFGVGKTLLTMAASLICLAVMIAAAFIGKCEYDYCNNYNNMLKSDYCEKHACIKCGDLKNEDEQYCSSCRRWMRYPSTFRSNRYYDSSRTAYETTVPSAAKPKTTTRRKQSADSAATRYDDDFYAHEYTDPEDFYYDNYDEFDDFEEAENYWYDYND